MPASDQWVKDEFDRLGIHDHEVSPLMRMTMRQLLESRTPRDEIYRTFKGPFGQEN